MKNLILLSLLALSVNANARKIVEEYIPEVMLEESTRDKTLKKTEAVYKFVFRNLHDGNKSRKIMFSIDGKNDTRSLIDNHDLEIKTTPGNHIFQFYYNDVYSEIYTDSLFISPGYKNIYSVYFSPALYQDEVEKPVIYLYPEETLDIEVKVDIKGTPLLLYPEYNDGWQVTANPDGTIEHKGETYNYLFWESSQAILTKNRSQLEGFIVEGEKITSFLEEKLAEAGLNSKEMADFITYWGPRMIKHEKLFVHFDFNDECNKYAELDISPQPDEIYRIFMSWQPFFSVVKVQEQIIQKVERKGYTVIEWGGQENKLRKITVREFPIIKQ